MNRVEARIPGIPVPLDPLTPKDEKDLEFAIRAGADWAALSHVQTPAEVLGVRARCEGRTGALAKIGTSLAVENLGEIIDLSDAIMVARGDLGSRSAPTQCRRSSGESSGRAARKGSPSWSRPRCPSR